MSLPAPFFARFDVDEVNVALTKIDPTLKEWLIVLGAVLVVLGAILVWIVAFRKPRRRHGSQGHDHHHHHHRPRPEPVEPNPEWEEPSRHRRRKRRREHRPRNPTLAETGGLPPLRADGPQPPPRPPAG
jgi:hypothetical protein